MPTAAPQAPANGKLSAFTLSLWVLALIAIAQLLVAAMALATRFEESQKVKIVEKTVATPVIVRVPNGTATPPVNAPSAAIAPPVSKPVVQAPPEIARHPNPTPLREPEIADPRAEKLFVEARNARIAGDMGQAIVKLEEAASQAPDNPNIRFELGLVHEQMGVFDTATSYYQKVFEMGLSQAGKYYHLAGKKLRDGFEKPDAMLGKLSLGRVRIFQNPNHPQGHRVILTIPVQKSPSEEIDIAELAVSVVFFNRNSKGQIIQLEDNSWVGQEWTSLPFDWAGGEESLRMIYTIPKAEDTTQQLFGELSYYGQTVTLTYKGETMAVQAWPSELAARMPRGAADADSSMPPEFQDSLPPDFNPDAPLLPALPEN